VLRYLYQNDALEKAQCEAGFCHALSVGLPLAYCANYGVFPCTSTIYDWRDGTLAAEEDWPSLLEARLCSSTYLAGVKQLLLPTNAACTSDALSSQYVRSQYAVYSPFNTSKQSRATDFVEANQDWVKSLAKGLDDARASVSATKATDFKLLTSGKAVNVWWHAEWLGPDYEELLYIDLQMAIISFLVIFVRPARSKSGRGVGWEDGLPRAEVGVSRPDLPLL
jgi:hypothetical protein